MDFSHFSTIINEVSKALGHDASLHVVGGAVRDSILGDPPTDLDLATKLQPEVVLQLLNSAGIRVIETGIHHGTVTALRADHAVEITTFRLPGNKSGYSENIETDLAARDFTINAIAFNLQEQRMIDPFGGEEDLRSLLVRAVGDPQERFMEDPLRILRMIRFGPAGSRKIEERTFSAAANLVRSINSVAPERIRVELEKILQSPNIKETLYTMRDLGLIQVLLPEVVPSIGCEQNEFHIHDVYDHTVEVVSRCPQDLTLRLTGLFHDLGKPHTASTGDDGRRHFYQHEVVSAALCREAMVRLKFPNRLTDDVSKLVKYHMRPLDCGPSGTRRLMRDLDHLLDRWLDFKVADNPPIMEDSYAHEKVAAFKVSLEAERCRLKGRSVEVLSITGDDILNLGVKPGRFVGEVLSYLREVVVETPELNTREALLDLAKSLITERKTSEQRE